MNKIFLKSMVGTVVSLISCLAFAGPSSGELLCKAKAKEVALNTYSDCITQYTQSKKVQIRDSYKAELEQLKAKYSEQLKELAGQDVQEMTKDKPTKARRSQSVRPTVSEESGSGSSSSIEVIELSQHGGELKDNQIPTE